MIELHRRDAVTIVELAHGKVNALDVEMIGAFDSALVGLSQDPAVSAIVLTGAGSAFSAGVDLRRVVAEEPPYLAGLISGLRRSLEGLFSFPKPTVAAVNGPAIAGGCILACACDRRVGVPGVKIGASELQVGVSFPASALEILRAASPAHVDEIIFEGRVYDAADALKIGMFHEIVDPEVLVDRAVEVAGSLGSIQSEAFRLAKEQLRRPALELMRSGASKIDEAVISQWGTPETRAQIVAQLERLKKP